MLTNVCSLITEENPLTLKYLFVALHDINLVHMLTVLNEIHSASDDTSFVTPIDFNDSLRFELFRTRLFTEDDPNAKSTPYVKVLFEDEVLPCSEDGKRVC